MKKPAKPKSKKSGKKPTPQTKRGTSKAAAEQRRKVFAETYLANGENGTRAYMEAFACTNTNVAAVEAHHLLRNPKIQKVIEQHRSEIRARFGLTTDRVMFELARVSYFNPKKLVDENGKLVPLHKLDDDTAVALAAVDIFETETTGEGEDKVVLTRRVKGRPFNKTAALDKAIKILRLYDKPPPLQPDEVAPGMTDPRETARRMAYLLARGAAATERDDNPPPAPQAKKKITVSL